MKTFTRLQSKRRSFIDLKFFISTHWRKLLVLSMYCINKRVCAPVQAVCVNITTFRLELLILRKIH